jgi:hypothetical protein
VSAPYLERSTALKPTDSIHSNRSTHKAKRSREAHLGGPSPSSGTRARSRTVTARTRWRCGEGARRATSRTPGVTCGTPPREHRVRWGSRGGGSGRKRRRDRRPYLLMQDARRAVGRTPPRPRREEERARAMTLDRAPTAEIAIFRRRRCDGRAERGEDYGEREVWGLAADGDLLGRGPRVVGPSTCRPGRPRKMNRGPRVPDFSPFPQRRHLRRPAIQRRCSPSLSADPSIVRKRSLLLAAGRELPITAGIRSISPRFPPAAVVVRACVPLLPLPFSPVSIFSGLIRQAVASPLASASSWSAVGEIIRVPAASRCRV